MTKQTQPHRDSSARLRRINIVVIASMLVLVGCARSDEPSPPPPNPAELMTQIQPSSAAKEATTTLTQGANHSAAAPNRAVTEVIGGPRGPDLRVDIQPGDLIPAEQPPDPARLEQQARDQFTRIIMKHFGHVKLSNREVDLLLDAYRRVDDGRTDGDEDRFFRVTLGVSLAEFYEISLRGEQSIGDAP